MKKFGTKIHQKKLVFKIYFIFSIFAVLITIACLKIYSISKSNTDIFSQILKIDKARSIPEIYSSDGKLLATSQSRYSLFLDKRHIDMNLLPLYINLINSKIKHTQTIPDSALKEFSQKFSKKNRVLIHGDLSKKQVGLISSYNKFLIKIGFFKSMSQNNRVFIYGAEFLPNSTSDRFYSSDAIKYEPTLGYYDHDGNAKSGFEKHVFDNFSSYNVEFSKKDRKGNSISMTNIYSELNKPIFSTLNSKLQEDLTDIASSKSSEFKAENILIAVSESSTGKMRAIVQSNKFNPFSRQQGGNFNNLFSTYLYEAGSVFKPITLSLALDQKLTTIDSIFDTNNGKLLIGKKTIKDEHPEKSMSVRDIIAESSNVGVAKISFLMEKNEFYDGLVKIHAFDPSTIEIPHTKKISMSPGVKEALKTNKLIQRATTSFGYGFLTTPYNLLQTYNIFLNRGKFIPLTLLDNTETNENTEQVVLPKTASDVKQTLIGVVSHGTGKAAYLPNLIIGGKTGTAHIAENGVYSNQFNASFIGFVQDKTGKSYSIIVVVIKPEHKYHFAAMSAVPVFNQVVKSLIKNNLICPSIF